MRHYFLQKNSPRKRVSEYSISDRQDETSRKSEKVLCPFRDENKKGKTVSKNHPFNITKKESENVAGVNKENPFMLSLGNRKRANEAIAEPSTSKKKKSDGFNDNIFSSTRIGNISHNLSSPPKTSRIDMEVANNTWVSKNGANVKTDANENIENEFDMEMMQFIEQFKNTEIVEIIRKIPARPKILRDHDEESPKGRVNFKIFKKVRK